MKIAIGHSDYFDAADALNEVLLECEQQLEGQTPKAGILFAGIDFDHQVLLKGIYEKYPNLLLVGGSSDAEISHKYGVVEDSVLLVLFCSDKIEFSVGYSAGLGQDTKGAVQNAIQMAQPFDNKAVKVCFTIFDTLHTSGLMVMDQIAETLGSQIPILGGAAADQFKMERSFQFANQQIMEDGVAVLLLRGDLKYSFGVSSGRSTTGERMKVGRVEGNRIFEIGGMTSVEFYTKYLGSLDKVIGEFPLAVYEGDNNHFFLRAPSKFHADGSIEYFADIPPGSTVQLTQANRDEIIGAVKEAYSMAIREYAGRPAVIQVTSCAGRKAVLGTRVKEEFEHLQALAGGVPLFGFYGFGELCPLSLQSPTKFHNETIVIWLLGE